MNSINLGSLADSNAHTGPLDLGEEKASDLLNYLRSMLVIRRAEEKIGEWVLEGKAKCPCHLGIGQEAIAVGISSLLRKSDRVFGGHRSHPHFLAVGGSVYELFAEILGKESGCSRGMGGSMHLYDRANGFIGSVPIVAATVPLAVGAGLAAKKDGQGDLAVSYFGDGAAEEGCVHESLNFASVFKVPVLFVCENNFFSSHLHINLRQPSSAVARFAQAHHIPFEIVDGNDVVAVKAATQRLTRRCRESEGPGFLEVVTYRWRGHVGPREDEDVGVKRKEDLQAWKQRDPIKRLVDALQSRGEINETAFRQMDQEVTYWICTEAERAEAAPYPTADANLARVYSSLPIDGVHQ